MFKQLFKSAAVRRRTSWAIALVLILPFVLFFHATRQSLPKGPGGIAGVIFGKQVPWEAFEEQRLWLRRELEAQFGQIPSQVLESLLTQYTWDQLIMVQEAKRAGRRVEDRDVATLIQRTPAFQKNGLFVPELYYRFLSLSNMSPQAFEARLRNDLLVQQLLSSVRNSVVVSDDEVKATYLRDREALKASLIVMDPASFSDQASAALTDEEVRARYDADQERVRVPEQLAIEYAGVSRVELAARVQLTDAEVEAFYEQHREEFAREDGSPRPLTEVRELVRERLANERSRTQLTALALDAQEDVEAKRPFDEIVTARGLTRRTAGPFPATSSWVEDGPDPAVLRAVADLDPGEMSGVVETESGVYLARVTQRLPSRIPPFEEVRAQVRSSLLQERARVAAKAAAEALHAKLKAAQASGLRFEETLLTEGIHAAPVQFTRTQPIEPLGAVPAVNEAAFATALGGMSEVLETPRGFVLLHPEERIPADEPGFTEAKDRLRQELVSRRQAARLEEWIKDVRDRAKLQSFVDSPSSGS